MDIAITSIGIANPPYSKSQSQAAEFMSEVLNFSPAEKRLLKSIYRSTGIQTRYSVISDYCKQRGEFAFFPNDINLPFPTTATRMEIYKKHALTLALAAIKNCLTYDVMQKVTHLITVSCTGMYAPGMDIEIVQQLPLNVNTKRTAINFMGCYGAFNGIKVAEAICRAEPKAKVLMVCAELCTLHIKKTNNMDDMIANAIFADGAAAVIIEANPVSKKYLRLDAFHCDLLPQTEKAMAWRVADSGFDIVLSTYVPEAIQSGIAEFAKRLLTMNQLLLNDIDFYAIHPGGQKILKACEAALNISEENNKYAYHVLRHYGNMSSATILFVLKNILDDLTIEDNNKTIFSCAFGPGLTLESMLLKIFYDRSQS